MKALSLLAPSSDSWLHEVDAFQDLSAKNHQRLIRLQKGFGSLRHTFMEERAQLLSLEESLKKQEAVLQQECELEPRTQEAIAKVKKQTQALFLQVERGLLKLKEGQDLADRLRPEYGFFQEKTSEHRRGSLALEELVEQMATLFLHQENGVDHLNGSFSLFKERSQRLESQQLKEEGMLKKWRVLGGQEGFCNLSLAFSQTWRQIPSLFSKGFSLIHEVAVRSFGYLVDGFQKIGSFVYQCVVNCVVRPIKRYVFLVTAIFLCFIFKKELFSYPLFGASFMGFCACVLV